VFALLETVHALGLLSCFALLGTSRIGACIRWLSFQGILFGLVPLIAAHTRLKAEQVKINLCNEGTAQEVVLENPTIYRIARLPTTLDTLFGELDRALTCKRCNTLPPDAAICLICGAAVCFQSHCCTDKEQGDRGECNVHTRE